MAEIMECVDCGEEYDITHDDEHHFCRARTCDGCSVEFPWILPPTGNKIDGREERLCDECKEKG